MTPYYDDGQVTIYCADNAVVLPTMTELFDLVFTSPPYNLGTTSTGAEGVAKLGHYPTSAGLGRRGNARGKWDGGDLADGYANHEDAMPHCEYIEWQHAFLRSCWSVLSDRGAIYYNHKPRILDGVLVAPIHYVPADLNGNIRQVVIWQRSGGVNFSPVYYLPTHEWIVVVARPAFRLRDRSASGVGDVWTITQESGSPHPAPFPVELPRRAIETTASRSVLDPFMGSGTTVVAARNAGVRAVGIEKSERYCEIAVKRLQQSVLPLAV